MFLESDASSADDLPLNLSLKTSNQSSSSSENSKNLQKEFDLATVNNLSNLQNLTAGIGTYNNDKRKSKFFV